VQKTDNSVVYARLKLLEKVMNDYLERGSS
jgi:hypothetical protein